MQFRKDIQGLRAIAVLAVWLFHLNYNLLPGGFIGVDIFFVISGYLISAIVLQQKEEKQFSFSNFYKGRIKRIVPAYYIFLLLISLATLFVYLPIDASGVRGKAFSALFFFSNMYFPTLDNYFGASSMENPYLHTWTLAIEMQFYLFLPLLLAWVNRKKSLVITGGLLVLLYAFTQYEIVVLGNQALMYFSLLARTPEFLLGVILALIPWKNKLSAAKQSFFGILGLLLILLSTLFIKAETPFPGLITLIPCGGAILILGNRQGVVNRLLAHKVLVYIGALSFSIYLWHWGILALMRYYYVEYVLTWTQYTFAIGLTILLSWLSYEVIERPCKRYRFKKLVLHYAFIPLLIGVLLLAFKTLSWQIYGNYFPKELLSSEPMGNENHSVFTNYLLRGDVQSNDTLLLIGNSHALVMKPFLDEVGKQYHFSFNSLSLSGIPLLPHLTASLFNTPQEYERYLALVPHLTSKLKEAPIILLGMTYDQKNSQAITAAIDQLSMELKPEQHLVLLSDFPTLNYHPIRKARSVVKSDDSSTNFKLLYQQPSMELQALIQARENLHFVDLSRTKAFESAPFLNDSVMYYDASHLNLRGSLAYGKASGHILGSLIEALLGR